MDKVIIFGAGRWGSMAYYFYENKCDIICYVDNNKEKWGTLLHDKKIVSPEMLSDFKGKVVIALQTGLEQAEKELKSKYGIKQFLEFKAGQTGKCLEEEQAFDDGCVVMEYAGGLGNQLFQYALAKYLEHNGCKTAADITQYAYLNMRKFELGKIFRNSCLRYASHDTCEYFMRKDRVSQAENLGERYIYIEPDIAQCVQYGVSMEWGRIKRGIVKGYFQTYLYADAIRHDLLECLEFPEAEDQQLRLLADEIKRCVSVSVHIRRGDYLAESERRMDGICDMQYYAQAIRMIRERVKNPRFYFFSDDILWCKENLKMNMNDAVYIDSEMFQNYEDWYDMYLMSRCKHNIIANSSFSWWGAWLNDNEGRIVIAPKKWDNFCRLTNICPPDWSRI